MLVTLGQTNCDTTERLGTVISAGNKRLPVHSIVFWTDDRPSLVASGYIQDNYPLRFERRIREVVPKTSPSQTVVIGRPVIELLVVTSGANSEDSIGQGNDFCLGAPVGDVMAKCHDSKGAPCGGRRGLINIPRNQIF